MRNHAALLVLLLTACGQNPPASPDAASRSMPPAARCASPTPLLATPPSIARPRTRGGPGDSGGSPIGHRPTAPPIEPATQPPTAWPRSGGPGCGQDSLCASLRSAYADAVLVAQRCDNGAPSPCGKKAPGLLGCSACDVWVGDTSALEPLAARFKASDCERCFFGSPTGDRCHPFGCTGLDAPICRASGAGPGSCVNQPRDRTCGAAQVNNAPCAPPDDYCSGSGRVCTCSLPEGRWSCF